MGRTLQLLNGHGNEERNKGNGDGEGKTEDMGEYLGKEGKENGTDRNLETTKYEYLQRRKQWPQLIS
jgi:hypothetical protein